MKFNKDGPVMLETPWLKKHVETHLLFGFFARSFPFALIYLLICGIAFFARNTFGCFDFLFSIIVGFLLLRLPKYHQAAIGWGVIKVTSLFVCFIMLTVGGLVGFFRGNPDAIHLTLLGLVWFPGPEFISIITEKQKYLTIGRILITIPIVILGYQTGNWH